jgi:hypothetical protein
MRVLGEEGAERIVDFSGLRFERSSEEGAAMARVS